MTFSKNPRPLCGSGASSGFKYRAEESTLRTNLIAKLFRF